MRKDPAMIKAGPPDSVSRSWEKAYKRNTKKKRRSTEKKDLRKHLWS